MDLVQSDGRININSIRFDNLSFGYENAALLFDRVSFDFPMNQFVRVQAESGHGRSTLLQMLAVLQNPTSGSFLINNQNVTEMAFDEFLPFRLNIGFGFDMGGLINNRTLLENLTLPLLYHKMMSTKEAIKRAEHYLREMDLLKYRDQRPAVVPGGVRKQMCLLRAIVHHPQLLLLDDPTVGLGTDASVKYFDLIQDLHKKNIIRHVFLSSFDESLMSTLNHTWVVIDNGLLHSFGPEGEKKAVHL